MVSNLLFIDTSAFFAFIDSSDENHKAISEIFHNSTEQFVTSNYILDELITLLRVRKIPLEKFKDFIDALWGNEVCNLVRIKEEIDFDSWKLMNKYNDHLFSFTDCSSFILMKNFNIQKVCTLDKHFQIAGFEIIN